MKDVKKKLVKLLRWSQKYTKTDMLYVVKGGFWLIFKRTGLLLISLLTLTAFANWVPRETYGAYKYVLSAGGILAVFTLPGMKSALTRSIAKKKEGTLAVAFKARMKWGLLGSAGMLAVAAWYFINQNSELGWAFTVATLFFTLKYAAVIHMSFWKGKKDFKTHSKYHLWSEALSAVVVITTIYLTDNLIYIVAALFGSNAIFGYILYLLARRKTQNKEVEREAISYGKHLTLMGVVGTIANHIDKIILWQFLGPAQVAIYSFAQQPVNKVQTFLPIKALALPKLSEKDMDEKRKSGMMNKFWRLLALSVVMAVGAIVLAPLVYQLVFPQYLDSVKYFQAFSLLFLLRPFALFGSSLTAEMKKREQYIVKSVSPFVQIILFLILIPVFGIWGAVIALLAGRATSSLLSLYFFKKMQPKYA